MDSYHVVEVSGYFSNQACTINSHKLHKPMELLCVLWRRPRASLHECMNTSPKKEAEQLCKKKKCWQNCGIVYGHCRLFVVVIVVVTLQSNC